MLPSFISGDLNTLVFSLFLIGNVAMFLASMIRTLNIAIAGEDILVELEACKEALQDLKIAKLEANGTILPALQNSRLEILIDRLSCHRGIRPRNYFTIGKANSFSSFGLVLTYYIVLLQFRFSES